MAGRATRGGARWAPPGGRHRGSAEPPPFGPAHPGRVAGGCDERHCGRVQLQVIFKQGEDRQARQAQQALHQVDCRRRQRQGGSWDACAPPAATRCRAPASRPAVMSTAPPVPSAMATSSGCTGGRSARGPRCQNCWRRTAATARAAAGPRGPSRSAPLLPDRFSPVSSTRGSSSTSLAPLPACSRPSVVPGCSCRSLQRTHCCWVRLADRRAAWAWCRRERAAGGLQTTAARTPMYCG